MDTFRFWSKIPIPIPHCEIDDFGHNFVQHRAVRLKNMCVINAQTLKLSEHDLVKLSQNATVNSAHMLER